MWFIKADGQESEEFILYDSISLYYGQVVINLSVSIFARRYIMKFSGKLKKARQEKKINQDELARMIGVSKRTIQNYENAGMYPKKRDIYYKLAKILAVDVNYLLTEDEEFLIDGYKKSDIYDVYDVDELIERICNLFTGGSLPDSDLDILMEAISEADFTLKKGKSGINVKWWK